MAGGRVLRRQSGDREAQDKQANCHAHDFSGAIILIAGSALQETVAGELV
jgi:hypothetical protein